jgi:hypothetical protein
MTKAGWIGGIASMFLALGVPEPGLAAPMAPRALLAAMPDTAPLLLLARHRHRHHHRGRWARYRTWRGEPADAAAGESAPRAYSGATVAPGYSTGPSAMRGDTAAADPRKPTIEWVNPDRRTR